MKETLPDHCSACVFNGKTKYHLVEKKKKTLAHTNKKYSLDRKFLEQMPFSSFDQRYISERTPSKHDCTPLKTLSVFQNMLKSLPKLVLWTPTYCGGPVSQVDGHNSNGLERGWQLFPLCPRMHHRQSKNTPITLAWWEQNCQLINPNHLSLGGTFSLILGHSCSETSCYITNVIGLLRWMPT